MVLMTSKRWGCAVTFLGAWLGTAAIRDGAVFRAVKRHGQLGARLAPPTVALSGKERAQLAGLDPQRATGHSLRVGLATSTAAVRVAERIIAQQTGHQPLSIWQRYIRRDERFRGNAVAALGL